MKKVFMLVAVATLALTGIVSAEEMAVKEVAAPAVEKAAAPAVVAAAVAADPAAPAVTAAVAIGNTVCPVSGVAIPTDALGKNTVEVNGKIINLCCADCKAKVMAEPEKYLKIAEESVAKAADPAAAKAAPAADAPAMPEMK